MILLYRLDMWHNLISWQWSFTSNKLMNLSNQFHKNIFGSVNFSPPHFTFFAFLLFIGSSLFCVDLEASSLDVDFGRASRGERLGKFYTCTILCEIELYSSWNWFFWNFEHEYQIMKLFTTCNAIGWKTQVKLVVYIVNLIHDSSKIGRPYC